MDLRFRNPTDQTLQLMVWLNTTHLCGEIRAETTPAFSHQVFETDHHFERVGDSTYRCNSIWQRRIEQRSGSLVDERLLYRNRSLVMYSIDP